jgi:hypothetical protein
MSPLHPLAPPRAAHAKIKRSFSVQRRLIVILRENRANARHCEERLHGVSHRTVRDPSSNLIEIPITKSLTGDGRHTLHFYEIRAT